MSNIIHPTNNAGNTVFLKGNGCSLFFTPLENQKSGAVYQGLLQVEGKTYTIYTSNVSEEMAVEFIDKISEIGRGQRKALMAGCSRNESFFTLRKTVGRMAPETRILRVWDCTPNYLSSEVKEPEERKG